MFTGRAQLINQEKAVDGVCQAPNYLLPLSPQFGQRWPESHIVDGLPLALNFLPLLDGVIGVHERPVVGDPELGQQLQGNGDIALVGSDVGIGEHHVVYGPQQRYLVTRYFRIVLEDGADNFI